MKNLSGQESLWIVFPILIVLIVLIAGIIFLPTIQTEIRGRASEPTPAIVTPAPPTETPEIVCSDLYDPVCGINDITYNNECEANLAGVTSYVTGMCPEELPSPTQATQPAQRQLILPSAN